MPAKFQKAYQKKRNINQKDQHADRDMRDIIDNNRNS